MKYGYKETRKIDMTAIRTLCIEKDWFTYGTNEEYGELLAYANRENITTDDIVEMATLIMEHSDISIEECTSIMYELGAICYSTFEEIA